MDLDASVGLRWTADEDPVAVASALRERLADAPAPEVVLGLGLLDYMFAAFDDAVAHLERAFLDFKAAGAIRRAAVAASHLGRVYHDGIGNRATAAGWFARGRRLIADDDCVERGWVTLAIVGCSATDIEKLDADAAVTLELARRFADVDLECKALADSGMALVGLGQIDEGVARIDEAMAMMVSGECDNRFIAGQVLCCMVSACERTGDLPRVESWFSERMRRDQLLPAGSPTMLYNHCQTNVGSLLCQAARWPEADTTLRLAVESSAHLHFRHRMEARAALARLRLGQGRVHEAAALLDGLDQSPEAQLAMAELHHARGDLDIAAAVARQALRALTGDRVRTAPLLELVVRIEVERGNVAAADDAAQLLQAAADRAPGHAAVVATAALATGRVAAAAGAASDAQRCFETGLQALRGRPWPLIAAQLHLELARVVRQTDVAAAVTEARSALAVFGRIGAREAQEAQRLLHELGVGAVTVQAPAGDSIDPLTAREREILSLLGEGMSNPQIAARLVISPKTAEHHVGSILRKLRLRSRSEAALYAASLRA